MRVDRGAIDRQLRDISEGSAGGSSLRVHVRTGQFTYQLQRVVSLRNTGRTRYAAP
jgi:hypothetical protein